MEVIIDGETEKVDVCNVIPAMKAGKIAELAGVTDGNWAPTIAHTMQSRKNSDIHILMQQPKVICQNQVFLQTLKQKYVQWQLEVN